jgi:hypothetical protein
MRVCHVAVNADPPDPSTIASGDTFSRWEKGGALCD